MSIDCAFFGFLAADAEPRTSQAGKPWVRLRVGVGKDDTVWVSVAVFGKSAETAGNLKKADRVYIEGTIKLDIWRGNDGAERHGLNVAAFRCEPTHKIGRNRPKHKSAEGEVGRPLQLAADADASAPLDDEIPF
ncbi:MAG: single-stranded DNA-binding protein [Xanthobacteraceae bacterium]